MARTSKNNSFLRGLAVAVGFLLTAPLLQARINVVTVPGRDTVQLTIYNSTDLTMVKETRTLTLRKGNNRLEFSWANTLIDPTSVEFRAITHADQVDVLDVRFPPRAPNTLEWHLHSDYEGEVICEIRYFTSGITWSADYVAEADRLEKLMTLAGHVRVTNNSGEDYENAQVRLVVGKIRLVEEIRDLGARKDAFRTEMQEFDALTRDKGGLGSAHFGARMGGREITKESVSEFFLYTVEGRDTIPNGWSKQLPSFRTAEVPFASYYKYEKERFGDRVMRYYRFKNDETSKLGKEPLPDGRVMAFRTVTPDNLLNFAGRTTVKYIPIGETVEMELGADQEIMVKPTLLNWQKTNLQFDQWGNVSGWNITETWQVEMQNSKEIDATLDIRRNFVGDHDLKTNAPHADVDANKVKFIVPLKSHEKKTFTYDVTTRYGTNVKK